MFTLVIGGSASGKSEYAEQHVLSLSTPEKTSPQSGNRIYIATMQPFGEDARARIARHHALRRDRGFVTIERYTDLSGLKVPEGSSVLLEDMGNL
ncbi:MAG: bifunctional adenosylcobinamide kinase/adenosylcobinamide-phosphate guanylyltransferase, partial [Lachnospiraceae bacterium]|nr:bifunctional adenosylcobinamide kinase/adenosylcobinamide-phosphate guanylyltransferase [Lachnospiraceae bacterium]